MVEVHHVWALLVIFGCLGFSCGAVFAAGLMEDEQRKKEK